MVAIEPTRRALRLPRAKTVVFTLILAMTAYVIVHNERFLIEPDHPVWQHYKSFQWWLLPHGVAGASALLLAPLQFSDRLRRRYAAVHRVVGRIYVAGVFVFAPLGAYIQWINEAAGASRSFTVAATVDAALVMVTTGIGLAFALKRMIPQHRQWMTRSYAVALVFFEGRLILGLTGLDQPPDPAVAEIVVWTCVALAVLVGDLANQWTELQGRRWPAAR
ncbi:DUF2306 domain-containing protein [Inquilinus sp.]|jgi:hypothetical protein|uniref:DUF2306 domain-containing protein n=1 Tax=Inquilinus sp. TaxID=1932117 RepID=UPI00378430E5